jgi:ADP-heptose:LPS heptosyltransferase
MGDVAMTIPVIYSLAQQYPQLQITVVTRPLFKRLFIAAPENIEFVVADTEDLHHGVRGLMRLIGLLKRRQFTAVADLHDVIRTRIIRYALRLKSVPVCKVDKDRLGRRKLTKKKCRDFQPNYIERYADVFRRLGYPVTVNFKGLFPETGERKGIGIAPFARYGTKMYKLRLMERVANKLSEYGVPIYLFGAPGGEAVTLQKWADRNPKLTVVAGTMKLEQELEAMSHLQVMLSMDSANMHMASLVGTKVVSIWGSTIPQCGFMGYGQSMDNAVWLDLECQPCSIAGVEECPIGHFACMARIAPQLVVNKVLKAIDMEQFCVEISNPYLEQMRLNG